MMMMMMDIERCMQGIGVERAPKMMHRQLLGMVILTVLSCCELCKHSPFSFVALCFILVMVKH